LVKNDPKSTQKRHFQKTDLVFGKTEKRQKHDSLHFLRKKCDAHLVRLEKFFRGFWGKNIKNQGI
jgi:hypothetical protein